MLLVERGVGTARALTYTCPHHRAQCRKMAAVAPYWDSASRVLYSCADEVGLLSNRHRLSPGPRSPRVCLACAFLVACPLLTDWRSQKFKGVWCFRVALMMPMHAPP